MLDPVYNGTLCRPHTTPPPQPRPTRHRNRKSAHRYEKTLPEREWGTKADETERQEKKKKRDRTSRITKYVTITETSDNPVGLIFFHASSIRRSTDFFTEFFHPVVHGILFTFFFFLTLRVLRMPAEAAKNDVDGSCDVMTVTLSKSAGRQPIRRFSGPP
jgi:hypothetical protein